MCAVGFSPNTPLANVLGHGVLGTARPGHGASWERERPARIFFRAFALVRAGRAVPRTPYPRKRLRGVKSAKTPFEPTQNHGKTPPPWG